MYRKITIEQENEIILLCNEKSQKEISNLYSITQACISKIFKRHGVKSLKKSRLNMSLLPLNVDYFKEINSHEKAYWLGMICADGNINKLDNKCSFVSKDKELVEKFKASINSGHTVSHNKIYDKRTGKNYENYSIQIGNELFVENLINLGITNKKSKECSFPNILEEYYHSFIAGLFDGDGSVYHTKYGIGINLISTYEIIDFIRNYIEKKIGINKLSITKIESKKKYNLYKLYLYKDSAKFLNFIYSENSSLYLQRKYKFICA